MELSVILKKSRDTERKKHLYRRWSRCLHFFVSDNTKGRQGKFGQRWDFVCSQFTIFTFTPRSLASWSASRRFCALGICFFFIDIYTCINTYINKYISTYIYVYIYMYIYIEHLYIKICLYICICIYIYICTCTNIHVCKNTLIHIYIWEHIHSTRLSSHSTYIDVYINTYFHTLTHIYIFWNTNRYTYAYTYMYTHTQTAQECRRNRHGCDAVQMERTTMQQLVYVPFI